MSDPVPFPGLEKFLFEAPLYARYALPAGSNEGIHQVDGYCPSCKREGPFHVVHKSDPADWRSKPGYVTVVLRCARVDKHQIYFEVLADKSGVQKYGQYPSYASIAQDETKAYRKYLSEQDGQELHKAIGLAAHGVGIGSFVYMRRILERIIRSRFDQYKSEEGWTEDDWTKRRTGERINLMRQHLPDFMVQNSKLYSILSLGIHELNEDDCLRFFPVARESLMFILEDDDRKKAELARRAEAQKAIAGFKSGSS
jgi:hypothetical protein